MAQLTNSEREMVVNALDQISGIISDLWCFGGAREEAQAEKLLEAHVEIRKALELE